MSGSLSDVGVGCIESGDTPRSYLRSGADDHPPLDSPAYRSSLHRHPRQPLLYLPQTLTELTGPALGDAARLGPLDADLTRQPGGEATGERLIVQGRVFDTEGKPLGGTLVEIWQANAAGRYRHKHDRWQAPLDPFFTGAGRCVTDDAGRYRFTTIKPGAYPWGNHHNAWRPAHIHFSLLGRAFTQRLVTQMYFPSDPLLAYDPIYHSIRDESVRERLVSRLSMHDTVPRWAQCYEFDIYLRGPGATPFEEAL